MVLRDVYPYPVLDCAVKQFNVGRALCVIRDMDDFVVAFRGNKCI